MEDASTFSIVVPRLGRPSLDCEVFARDEARKRGIDRDPDDVHSNPLTPGVIPDEFVYMWNLSPAERKRLDQS
jgi:hypothetical protein